MMEYRLRWSKGAYGWETRFEGWSISIQENGAVHISDNPYYLNFTYYPSFETAAPVIKDLMDKNTELCLTRLFESVDQAKKDFVTSDSFKRIYGNIP
jgi:hypothetical protein